jgi:hypothetical protein
MSMKATMGNIRCRQDNVSNIQELLPTCIAQFTMRADIMVKAINTLDKVKMPDDKDV